MEDWFDPESDVPRSTQWARLNTDQVRERTLERQGTLDGKLISLITQSRYRSKKKDIPHNIDTKYLRGLYKGQEGLCALSGTEMSIRGDRGTDEYWRSISLDRIDSGGGYTEGNVQLVCTGINYMKKDMSDELFINFCKQVVENFNEIDIT